MPKYQLYVNDNMLNDILCYGMDAILCVFVPALGSSTPVDILGLPKFFGALQKEIEVS